MPEATPTASSDPSGLGFVRRLRRALILIPLAMAAALTLTVFTSFRHVSSAVAGIDQGQGETFLNTISRETRPGVNWTEASLEELLVGYAADGLACIAVFSTDLEELLAAVGECGVGGRSGDDVAGLLRQRLLEAGSDRAIRVSGRWRMAAHLPPGGLRGDRAGGSDRRPPPLRRRPPPRRRDGGPPPWRRPPPARDREGGPPGDGPPRAGAERRRPPRDRRPLPVMIEFEPRLTAELESGAWRTLGIGTAASLALMVAALVFWRLSLRAQQLQEKSARDRRLASLGEMSAVMAHELRNPLASVKGNAQLLVERLPEGSRERDKAERVVREVIRLERLSSDLLSFVRMPHLERVDVSPAEVAREAVESVGGERVSVDASRAPDRWSLDPVQIHQVLTNLIRNAVQASPERGEVEVGVRLADGRLQFSVRDHGDGIPDEIREHLFEPFRTTRVRGTGLGLAVAQRIVELHHGMITAHNHPQGGAVFQVSIPNER